jgi:hypothetical protein
MSIRIGRKRAMPSALLLGVAALAGCQGGASVVAPTDMTISALNATSKQLVLVVNGSFVRDLPPGGQIEVAASELPALPWTAEVRLVTGRALVSIVVHAGDVVIEGTSQKGDAKRVDLSCGRIDLWSGPPLLGPAAGSGTDGDCAA